MTAPQTGRIFISYRRIDSAGYAGRIYDRLAAHFGKDAIFMDVDTIEAGLDFVEVLESAVQSCDVLVALIGRQWLSIKDEAGKRRLDNPQDFVRIEVAAALSRSIRVIPVLVDGVPIPNTDQLPSILEPLARRNAVLVTHYSFHNDANRLIEQLELALKAAEKSRILKTKRLKEKEANEKRQAEIDNLLSQADIALNLQDWELAKEKLEAIAILEPEHVQAQVKLAIVDRKLQEVNEKNVADEKVAKAIRETAEKAEKMRKERERIELKEKARKERESADKAAEKKAKEKAAKLITEIGARRKSFLEAAKKVNDNVFELFRKGPSHISIILFITAIIIVAGYSSLRLYSADQITDVTSTARAITNAKATENALSTSTAGAIASSIAIANAQATENALSTSTARAIAGSTTIANAQATAKAKATGTASAKANAQATQDAKYFFDGFNDNSNKWSTGSIGNEKVYSSFATISDGVYAWDVTEVIKKFVAFQTIPDEKSFEDFILSVDARNISNNLDICYGLSFRTNGLFSYWFSVCDSQKYRIGIGDDSGGKSLSGWTNSSAIKSDNWNQIKVIATGSQFEFYINNVQVEQITDTALTSGTLGVAFEATKTEPGQVWFDNFQYEIR